MLEVAGAFAETVADWLAGLSLVLAALGCAYLALSSLLVLRFARRCPASGEAAGQAAQQPPVTILKPLCGAEPGLAARLATFCHQRYRGPVQVVFGVHDAADPAVGAVREVKAACPAADLALVVSAELHGSNRKVSNLINMLPAARHQLLVVADSDIEVGPDYLAEIVRELLRPGVGAVTCLYHGAPAGGFWARFAALGTDSHFLPDVVAGLSLKLAQPCFGSTVALRRDTLDRVGGLEAFADCLADDYAVGRAVRALGGDVRVPRFAVGHGCFQPDARTVIGQELRYARTIRGIDPLGHAGSLVTHPLPLAVLAVLCGAGGAISLWALPVAGLAIAGRCALTRAVERAFGLGRHAYWMLPLRDLVSFAVYVGGFVGATVSWRGFRYRTMSDGTLVQHRN